MPGVAIAADQTSLTAHIAILTGLSYDGIASVPTADGRETMLKFSMRTLELPGIVLSVTQGGHVLTTRDSTLVLNGDVELFTTKISGILAGIRVTFTAASPPAGLRPDLTLTSVVAEQVFATANSLHAVTSQDSTG